MYPKLSHSAFKEEHLHISNLKSESMLTKGVILVSGKAFNLEMRKIANK